MIKICLERHKGSDVFRSDQERTVHAAFDMLLECELGFGSEILELTPTTVVTKTRVLGDIDYTTFTGSEEDMRALVQAAAYGTLARSMHLSEEHRPDYVKKVMEFTEGNPGLISMSSDIILGNGVKRVVAVAVLADGKPELIETLSRLTYTELLTLLEWKLTGEDEEFIMSCAIEQATARKAANAQT